MTMLQIAVGSTNPAKIEAVSRAFDELNFGDFDVEAVAFDGADAQPWGERSTRQGAVDRARAARTAIDADWGIGLEGGMIRDDRGILVTSWIAACRTGSDPGLARTAGFYLPPGITDLVLAGHELADAWQQACGLQGIGRSGGTVGLLTGGRIDRTRLYSESVILAVTMARSSPVAEGTPS